MKISTQLNLLVHFANLHFPINIAKIERVIIILNIVPALFFIFLVQLRFADMNIYSFISLFQ